MKKQTKKQTKRQSRDMRLEEHIADTLKEWELKLGKIDGGIRLYYPCDSIREYLGQAYTVAQGEDLAECVRQYLQAEATYLGPVKTEYHEGRIAVQIPEEGCQYVAEQMEYPELLVCEDREEDSGCVLYFDREEVDPYVYCFDADDFGVTYHRFARVDYEKLTQ